MEFIFSNFVVGFGFSFFLVVVWTTLNSTRNNLYNSTNYQTMKEVADNNPFFLFFLCIIAGILSEIVF